MLMSDTKNGGIKKKKRKKKLDKKININICPTYSTPILWIFHL